MCLGVPAKVIRVDNETATVLIGEVSYQANVALLDEVVPGDYIILHAGFGIEKVDPLEAEETIRLIKEMERLGQEHDHGSL